MSASFMARYFCATAAISVLMLCSQVAPARLLFALDFWLFNTSISRDIWSARTDTPLSIAAICSDRSRIFRSRSSVLRIRTSAESDATAAGRPAATPASVLTTKRSERAPDEHGVC